MRSSLPCAHEDLWYRQSEVRRTQMDLTRTLKLLLLLLFPFAAENHLDENIQYNFIGVVESKDSDLVVVDEATKDALQSRLTTVFFPVLYIFIFIIGLPANGMAIWVFLFRTKKKHPSSIYMANLALADLLFVIWMPLKIAYHFNGNDWVFGEPLCKVLMSFFYGNMYCSVLFIACLSVQRYWVVAHPLSEQRRKTKVAVCVCVAIWAFIWLTTTPLYLYDHTAKLKEPNVTTCHDVMVIRDPDNPYASHYFYSYSLYYFIFLGVVGFLVPCVVIIVSYVLLLRALGNSMGDSTAAMNRQKAVVLIVVVLLTFLVCFIPSNIMMLIHYLQLKDGFINNSDGSYVYANKLYGFYITTLCLASLNSCFDPFVYYFISEDFREHVKNTFLCRSERKAQRMKVSFSALKFSKKTNKYKSESGNTQSTEC